MTSGSLGWWSRRSLRLRVTAAATAVLAIGLVVGTVILASVFEHRRVSSIDVTVRSEVTTISQLAEAGDLPSPLPSPAGATTLAQVVDSAGTVLAATSSASRVLQLIPIEQLAKHHGRPFTTSSSTIGSSSLRVLAVTVKFGGVPVTVVAAAPLGDVTSTLNALRNVLLIVVPLILLAAAVATWLAVSAALQPVDRLRAAADAVDVTVTAEPPKLDLPAGGEELRKLGATLNELLRRVHMAAETQRRFIADAAHELRSPISSLRTQLEVALTVPNAPEDWPHIVADALADVERLGQLAEDLLLLARLDSGAPQRRATVDIGTLVDDPGGNPLLIDGDELALRRLFDNLLSNARRYARESVAVKAERVGGEVVVTVDDDGPGIPPPERERVFQPWVRLDAGRGRGEGGAGLGLAIVRSIARAHGGDVALQTSPMGGLRAVVRLPATASPRAVVTVETAGKSRHGSSSGSARRSN
jgi:signal transduction histidine kinase